MKTTLNHFFKLKLKGDKMTENNEKKQIYQINIIGDVHIDSFEEGSETIVESLGGVFFVEQIMRSKIANIVQEPEENKLIADDNIFVRNYIRSDSGESVSPYKLGTIHKNIWSLKKYENEIYRCTETLRANFRYGDFKKYFYIKGGGNEVNDSLHNFYILEHIGNHSCKDPKKENDYYIGLLNDPKIFPEIINDLYGHLLNDRGTAGCAIHKIPQFFG